MIVEGGKLEKLGRIESNMANIGERVLNISILDLSPDDSDSSVLGCLYTLCGQPLPACIILYVYSRLAILTGIDGSYALPICTPVLFTFNLSALLLLGPLHQLPPEGSAGDLRVL